MSVEIPVEGQKVLVIFEAEFSCRDSDGELWFNARNANGSTFTARAYEQIEGLKIEFVVPPLVDRAIYQDASGCVWRYSLMRNAFIQPGGSMFRSLDHPTKPLTRLVPETSGA